MDSGDDLLGRCQAGQPAAFAALMLRYQERLWRYLCRVAGNSADAEDLLQETFLTIAQKVSDLAPTARLDLWIFVVARNKWLDSRRRDRSRKAQLERMASTEANSQPPDFVGTLDLNSVLSRLDEDDRNLLALVAEGFSANDIAQVLLISPQATRKRIERARSLLESLLVAEPAP